MLQWSISPRRSSCICCSSATYRHLELYLSNNPISQLWVSQLHNGNPSHKILKIASIRNRRKNLQIFENESTTPSRPVGTRRACGQRNGIRRAEDAKALGGATVRGDKGRMGLQSMRVDRSGEAPLMYPRQSLCGLCLLRVYMHRKL